MATKGKSVESKVSGAKAAFQRNTGMNSRDVGPPKRGSMDMGMSSKSSKGGKHGGCGCGG